MIHTISSRSCLYLRCAGPYTAVRTSDKVGVCLHIRHGRVLDTAGGILIHSDSIGDSPRNRIGIIAIRIDSTQNESIRIDSQGYQPPEVLLFRVAQPLGRLLEID